MADRHDVGPRGGGRHSAAIAEGRPAKREVAVSARSFDTARKDDVLIERRDDACGHASTKPMTLG